MFNKKIFWIASYPRSGNTWLRFVFSSLFFDFQEVENKWDMSKLIPDIHISKSQEIFSAPSLKSDNKISNISLCKTHYTQPTYLKNKWKIKNLKTIGFLYLYRHPLDVLISAINFSYYKGINKFFFDDKLRTPSQLYEAGIIDQYLIHFMEKETEIKIWKDMSGTWLKNVDSWLSLQNNYSNSIVINYDELVQNPVKELMILKTCFPQLKEKNIIKSLDVAQKLTFSKKQNSFFWKKKTGNYKKYFNQDLIDTFNKQYKDILSELNLDSEF